MSCTGSNSVSQTAVPFHRGLFGQLCAELLEDLLKSIYRLSYRQVSLQKAKLPSKECNKDHAFTTIKYFKLISGNETKGEAGNSSNTLLVCQKIFTPGVPEAWLQVLPEENLSGWCLGHDAELVKS